MRAWLEPRIWKGPRRALAALVMCFFALLYGVVAALNGEEWRPALLGLSGCYLVGFVAVVAPWFWGRWYAAGLSWSGALIGALSLAMNGWAWPLALYAGLHGAVILGLAGKSMSADYELQTTWREKFRMDDLGVARLGKAITRSAASLPSVVLWALGPKEPGQGVAVVAAGALALVAGVVGLRGLVRLRTWGLFAAAAAVVVAGGLGSLSLTSMCSHFGCGHGPGQTMALASLGVVSGLRDFAPWLGGALAVAILLPFGRATAAYLRR